MTHATTRVPGACSIDKATMAALHSPTADGRDLWLVTRDDVRDLLLRLPRGPFVVLLTSASESDAKSEAMVTLVEALLAAGCVYFVCAGERAELLHDVVDAIFVGDATTSHFARGVEMMTTWHERESPEEVAFFLLRCAIPADGAPTIVAILESGDGALRRAIDLEAANTPAERG